MILFFAKLKINWKSTFWNIYTYICNIIRYNIMQKGTRGEECRRAASRRREGSHVDAVGQGSSFHGEW